MVQIEFLLSNMPDTSIKKESRGVLHHSKIFCVEEGKNENDNEKKKKNRNHNPIGGGRVFL